MGDYWDTNWNLPDGPSMSYEAAQLAVLMDIRRELKRLNLLLSCPNFVAIPRKLDRIEKNTSKPKHGQKKA